MQSDKVNLDPMVAVNQFLEQYNETVNKHSQKKLER